MSISPRKSLKIGWETRPSVSVSQNRNRAEVLEEILEYFDCGTIRPDPSDSTVKWETRNLGEIRSKVLPHFDLYPLRSSKHRDVMAFKAVCDLVAAKAHLRVDGLVQIVDLAAGMNPSGTRRYDPETIKRCISEVKA